VNFISALSYRFYLIGENFKLIHKVTYVQSAFNKELKFATYLKQRGKLHYIKNTYILFANAICVINIVYPIHWIQIINYQRNSYV
jgi:hypothetical protein